MAKFMVKKSELKNICKAVDDRKLAELKKEIIEILKKQDEKDFKKAVDYLESQELHYTHLEKSFTGKWVEKAGYGIGTVRIWKGKKYKKIAPGKWARVFEKEGRGTNIAIGKLIARVQKIDNVEDLMAFVMANKQRFVDENGVDLPVLDKLRAAVDARNGNVGSKGKTETKFDSKEVLANLDKYVKTIGGVYGIKKYTEDDDTEKTFARIKDHFDSDSTRTYDDAQGWNQAARQIAEYAKKEGLSTDELIKQSIKNNIKDESIEGTPTFGGKKTEYMERLEEQSKKAEEGKNRQTETKVNGYGEATDREITSLAYKRDVARKERDFNSYFGRGMDKKNNTKGYSKPAEKTEDNSKYVEMARDKIKKYAGKKINTNEISDIKIVDDGERSGFLTFEFKSGNDKYKMTYDSGFGGEKGGVSIKKIESEKSEAEKTQNRSDAMKGNQNAKKLFTNEDGAEDYFKTIVSPFEFNIGEAKVRMEIREKTNLPPDVSQIPFDLVVVRDNASTVVGHPKSYEDAYDEILETIRGENSSLSTEWPDMNGKFVRLHNRYAMDSLKPLPKEDIYGNKVDDFIDEEIKNKAGSFKKNTKELQNELMSLSKQKSEILDEIKRTNGDLAKINQDKYNDEARGNPTEDYDKQIEELKKKMDNLQDEHADIEKRGNDIVKELDKLEKEEKKVIENNPKSVEGMDFVNKNKMHVLANFLANHDNVNMATAVIRLQAAYEKLGEEKFLAHFPKDIVERYRKEAGKEEPKKKSFTPISKDKMKSMSDDELKDYEAKLEKDLLATSRTDPDYVEKYNHWREVHGENNDRFHQAIEDEARAEKQAEADAKSAKEKEINEKYNGYFENRKGLDKARDLKTLEKKYNFDGKVMSSKEFVEQAIDNGADIKEREVNKLDYPSRTRWNRMNGYEQDEYEKRIKAAGKKTVYSINGFEFPKTVVDYAKFYKEKGKAKSGNEKPSKSETAIKNKATSLAGAFGYSKTYATKMGSPFNLELAEQTVDEELDWDEGSKKALKEELKRIYSEKKVQKSLFDDFVMDMFIDEDEEIEDAIKTDESLFNDYSAEQPELFNSTELKVREAMNRHYCNCL